MPKAPTQGTQSIARAIGMMKAIAERKQIGWRLTDLATRCGLGKATTHRIVAQLIADRIVTQRAGDRRYVPGPLMFELAVCTPGYFAFTDAVRPVLARIAKAGVNAYLYLRSGEEVVCVDNIAATPVQPLTSRGRRLPIAQSTFGIAMILAMAKDEQRVLLDIDAREAHSRSNALAYRKVLFASRRCGFGFNPGLVAPGLTSVAVAVLDAGKRPFAAIGVAAPSPVLAGARAQSIAQVLRREADQLERECADLIAEIIH